MLSALDVYSVQLSNFVACGIVLSMLRFQHSSLLYFSLRYMMGETVPTSLAQLSGAMKAGGAAAPAAAAAPAPAAPAAVSGYSLADVAKHTTKEDCWVVVNGQVRSKLDSDEIS